MHMRPLFAAAMLALLTSCGDKASEADCAEFVMADASGAADDCDLQACEQACGDCSDECFVLESYPPQYQCGSGETVDVYDVCPDWSMDSGTR